MAERGLLANETATGTEADEGYVALLVVDDDYQCIDVAPGACRLLGMSRDEVLGKRLDALVAPSARERFRHVWQAFREAGGHAGPFLLDGVAPFEANITVTARVLPSRHLVVLTPTDRDEGWTNGPAGARDSASRTRRRAREPSARERQVLRLLASGATDVQVGAWLSLSPATVQTHVRNAKAKLGARTRAQAVALALQRGMITPSQ
jgi:DNA-binding CsgD family transcriptional regulator